MFKDGVFLVRNSGGGSGGTRGLGMDVQLEGGELALNELQNSVTAGGKYPRESLCFVRQHICCLSPIAWLCRHSTRRDGGVLVKTGHPSFSQLLCLHL